MNKKPWWQSRLLWTLVGAVAMLGLLTAVICQIAPDIWSLLQEGDHEALIEYVRSFGWRGALVLFLLQLLQSVVPFFPEVLLQLAAGVTYGPWWGTVILTMACALANCGVFYFLHRFRPASIRAVLFKGPLKPLAHFCQSQNANTAVFILYLFPFLSNGFVPYFAALTDINWRNFIFAAVGGSFPLMFVTVLVGDRLIVKDYWAAVIAFVVGVVASLILYFLKDKMLSMLRKNRDKSKDIC